MVVEEAAAAAEPEGPLAQLDAAEAAADDITAQVRNPSCMFKGPVGTSIEL